MNMQHDNGTWHLAKLLVEQHGPDALHGARKAAEILRYADVGEDADLLNIVRAMDFLLSDEGSGTIH